MSKKPFDYSKWDNIELSDDEDDVHPNIDRESWFRLKHRSRVEREEQEERDKKRIREEMEKANQRIKVLEHDLKNLAVKGKKNDDSDDDDDDDLDESVGLKAELEELLQANAARRAKLDEYEKNKKWNIDNMFHVKEERTIVNPGAGQTTYTETGFVKPKDTVELPPEVVKKEEAVTKNTGKDTATPVDQQQKVEQQKVVDAKPAATAKVVKPAPTATKKPSYEPSVPPPPVQLGAMETYHEFTEKYAEVVELFMAIPDFEGSKDFLLKYADILLQENASNYLLLASLEDEMNGYREKMKRTARQSQIITNIAELAKTLKTHPGNVIMPFFQRLQQREYLEDFLAGVNSFAERIIKRAVVKKAQMDEARRQQAQDFDDDEDGTHKQDLTDIPREQRLGPGGLDPLEVIETLPEEMVKAFESRDVDQLKEVLMKMDPNDAEYHMKRCVDSGLWVAQA